MDKKPTWMNESNVP